MANIPISDIQTSAETLENEDLILVSKKNGSSFLSAKMKGSVLSSQIKSSIGSASSTSDGLMSSEDKNKLDSLYENLKDVKLNISEDNSLVLTIGTNKYRVLVTQLNTVESVQV